MLSDEVFEAAVRAEVAENPYHVYDKGAGLTCDYVRDGEPSCLIGKALFRAGVDVETIAQLDEAHRFDVDETTADVVLPRQFGLSEQVSKWARRVQIAQDCGDSWGWALQLADS